MRYIALVLSIACLVSQACEADEKPLFVVHSNYRENKTAQWKMSINSGSATLAVTSDGKSVKVSKENLQEVVADLATQEEEPKALTEDLKVLGYEVISKQEYDPQKHSGPIVAVTVNNVVGAVPGMGYVFFGKDFFPPKDLRDGDKVARASKIQWSDAQIAVDGKMTRQYDGPGTPVFLADLEKVLRETGLSVGGQNAEKKAGTNENHTGKSKQSDRERGFVDPRDWSALMTQDAEWREENGRFRLTVDDGQRMTITYADGRNGWCLGAVKGGIILFGGDLSGTGSISVDDRKLVMTVIRKAEEGKPDETVRLISSQKPPKPRADGT